MYVAQSAREKQSSNVQQHSSSVQTTGVLKRSSGHKRHYPPQFKHPPRVAAARVLRDNVLLKNNIRCENKAMRGLEDENF